MKPSAPVTSAVFFVDMILYVISWFVPQNYKKNRACYCAPDPNSLFYSIKSPGYARLPKLFFISQVLLRQSHHNYNLFCMLLSIFYLVLGLVLILVGASALTDGASAIARRSGISELVIGLTIVAFGTSAPELVITAMSAAQGSAGIAIGNVVGSNIFNVLVIIGVTSMLRPISIERSIMANEIPMVILSALVLLVMGNGPLLDGEGSSVLSRVDGIVLLLFFALFMRYTFSRAKAPSLEPAPTSKSTAPSSGSSSASSGSPSMGMAKAWIWTLGGLAMLIWGGDRFVDGASEIAKGMGVSEAMVGLTIVAAGTSLPELAASVAAALKGSPGLALGNVIGSNIFNIFFVAGVGATIRPLPFGSIGNVDLLVLLAACLIFWLFGWIIRTRTITRGEGAVMLAGYIAYTVWLISNA